MVRREGSSFFRATGSGVSGLWAGRDGVTVSRSVCGSSWPYPQYLQAWPDPDSVVTASLGAPSEPWDPTDPDSESDQDGGCFPDTSGF